VREVVGGVALALAYLVAIVVGGMVLAFAPLILIAWALDNL